MDEELAALYDLFPFQEDVPFYVELARGLRVLELACGSGRLLAALAGVAESVVGVDASPHMLARARRRLRAEAAGSGSRMWLVEADMRTLDGEGRPEGGFDLAVVAAKGFGYLLTVEDQLASLGAIHRALAPGGRLALDLLNPTEAWLRREPGWLWTDLLQEVPDQGVVVSRKESVVATDHTAQVRTMRSEYEVVDGEGLVRKRFAEWPIRWTTRFEAEHLLGRAGFEVRGVHGGYDGGPYEADSPTLLIVAARA
jgi:SAM-dependent methyltransferase